MAIKDILVHLNGTDRGADIVEPAITMARKHDARLIGLFAGVPYDMPIYVAARLPAEVVKTHQTHVEESAAKTAKFFEDTCNANGVSFETRTGDWRDPVEHTVSIHARYADMVMIMQPEPDANRAREIADHVVLRSGAPTLVVPTRVALKGIGARVLIGWDGSVHAARAVRDALPILVKADAVKVLAVNPKPGLRGLGDLPGADLAHYLATHDVTAEADHLKSDDVDTGSLLLSQAAGMGADMIVAGGYGHARIGELILGGVTDTLMTSMTVPVLFSH